MKNKSKEKNRLNSQRAITLIALVVTIVVLLILAGVSLNLVIGNNGIISKAKEARDATKYANIKDEYDMYKTNRWLENEIGDGSSNFNSFLDDLQKRGIITAEDKAQIKSENKLTISEKYEISFAKTLADVYSDNDIGKKLTYSANGQEDWIIFGKDKDGNILLTTEAPVADNFELKGTVEAWLSYEDDLDKVCLEYGDVIQGVNVTARSITMEDINNVMGFTEPKFDTYTFGEEQDYENKKVNYYYPNKETKNNWQDPKVKPATFKNDWYGYGYIDGNVKYAGADIGGKLENRPELIDEINVDKFRYVIGENSNYFYAVASHSTRIESNALLCMIGYVGDGIIAQGGEAGCCYSTAERGYNRDDMPNEAIPVRPVVVLPSILEVEIIGTEYDLAK